jgi:hypothetical protein
MKEHPAPECEPISIEKPVGTTPEDAIVAGVGGFLVALLLALCVAGVMIGGVMMVFADDPRTGGAQASSGAVIAGCSVAGIVVLGAALIMSARDAASGIGKTARRARQRRMDAD